MSTRGLEDQELVEYTWYVLMNSLLFLTHLFSLPNFTHVANNVLCSARLRPARGVVLSLLVMLMAFARMWAVVPWWKLMHNAVPICYYKSHEA